MPGCIFDQLKQYNITFSNILIQMPKSQAETEIRRRIELEGDPRSIEKLCLDEIQIGTFSKNVKQILQSCTSLQYLTLNSCKLRSLQNFPVLPNLITLELVDNELSSGFEKLEQSKQISFLSLSSNSIGSLIDLQPLSRLKELEILIVLNNPIVEIDRYRQHLFEMLPSLNTIDRYGRDNTLLSSEDLESYITDRYRSFQNVDDLLPGEENEMEKEENEGRIKDNEGMKASSESMASKEEIQEKKRVRLYRRFQSSDEQSSNEMIKHFKRLKRDIQ